jgi:arabinogalactan endo-1,4-beta-galactosidase
VSDYPPTNPQDYADFAAYAAQRWGRYLAAVELWNEPNGGLQFISAHPVRNYLALVQAAYPAVKAVDPNLQVLISMGGTDTTFLNQLYLLGVKGYYDGIAVHPYYQPTFAGLKALRADQVSQGDHAPLWVTEVGWDSDEFGLQGQATNIVSALQQLATLPYVAAAEIYDIRDAGTDATNNNDSWGLLDYNLNPKPAWNAFESELQSLAGRATG